jgi:coatomer protein complex subunit gamma
MYDFLDGLLRHKSDMVNIEAARAICDMKGVTPQELYRPVAGMISSNPEVLFPGPCADIRSSLVLQLFLSSPKSVLKFAAIKSLNKLAMVQPSAVSGCNVDIENLITDPNRSIATYAITTLLKVSEEG